MSEYPPIFILRHGQTVWNVERRLQGSQNSPLTELGRLQAADQGRILQSVFQEHPQTRIVCSPQGRTRETANIALAGLSVPVEYDPRVVEISAGDWEGMERHDIMAQWPDLYNHDISSFDAAFNAIDGEGWGPLQERCTDFLSTVDMPTVIFTHGITCKILRGMVCGLNYDAIRRLPLEQGCVYSLIDGSERTLTL